MSEPLSVVLRLLLALVLVGLNGFFVAAEFALVSVRGTRMAELEDQGVAGAGRVRSALDHLDRYIAATQLGVTMASLALGALGEPVVAAVLRGALGFLPTVLRAPVIAVVLAFVLITALQFVCGELAPKSLALQRPERTALRIIGPMMLFLRLFQPVIVLLDRAGSGAVGLLGVAVVQGQQRSALHSAEELELLVEQSGRGGALEDLERRMLRGVFDVGDHSARQAMTPRTKVQGLPLRATLDEATRLALASRHTRLPVYEHDLDQIVGAVHLRDLLQAVAAARAAAGVFSLRDLLRPLPAVPEAMTLDEVLVQLREQRSHMALVVDEYGGTAGILTLEDILDEIVGAVPDEFDVVRPAEIAPQPDGSWLLDGMLPLDEVDEHLGTALSGAVEQEGQPLDVDTLAGLVVARLGRLAEVGDEIQEPDDPPLLLRVEEIDERRVARVRLIKVVAPQEHDEPLQPSSV